MPKQKIEGKDGSKVSKQEATRRSARSSANLLHQNLNLNQEKHLLRKNLEQRLAEVQRGKKQETGKEFENAESPL
uniref:Uncharacterized protein n=1 Tax=Urocitellus parryii TaxID=9999 RepID=A0A8D2GZG8_UROPR